MSSAPIAEPSAASAQSPKKRAKSQKKKTGPTASDLMLKAVSVTTERGGVSLPALKKALKAGGYDVAKNNARVLTAIRRLVANESLLQTKGTGASGSFKLNKKAPTPGKKKAVKKKKPRAKKVRTGTKGATGSETPAARKSPKKKSKAKSPKKAKRSAATKKPKGPKGAKQGVARSTRTRSAARK